VIALMALAASSWLALLLCAPLLPVPVAGLTYLAGALICHQLPGRSFHTAGAQLPVCARCLGIYAGVALTTMFLMPGFRVPRSMVPGSRRVLIGGTVPTLMTLVMEWLGVWAPSNLARAAAGVVLGAAIAFVVADALAKLHYVPCVPQRPIAPRPPPTPI
jgi:uncharacterized membrane protein